MKKLIFVFLILFSSCVFSLELTGLDYVDSDSFSRTITETQAVITLKQGMQATATAESIQKAEGFEKEVVLILEENSKLFNKENSDLIISEITLVLKGADIYSRGKNFYASVLVVEEPSVSSPYYSSINSSGADGETGTWNGPLKELNNGECGNCTNYNKVCAIDSDSRKAKKGKNAGNILIDFAEIKADVSFLSKGGKGGNGANGKDEAVIGTGVFQYSIRGGNGADGGNAGKITINELNLLDGLLGFNVSGGEGGSGGSGGEGGEGGDNTGAGDAHDGGDGGNGGNAGKIEINKLINVSSSEIQIFSLGGQPGSGGSGGKTLDWMGCDAQNGLNGQKGFSGEVILTDLKGTAPKQIKSGSILLDGFLSEKISFLTGTNYSALTENNSGNLLINACGFSGEGMQLTEQGFPQISFSADILEVKSWNPLLLFDKTLLNAGNLLAVKDDSCNLTPRKLMRIPFNGRIKDKQNNLVESGSVKDIQIINSLTNEIEFEDSFERSFSNGVFSTLITAELYSNSFYEISFSVCSDNECDDFAFQFFTWKRLW